MTRQHGFVGVAPAIRDRAVCVCVISLNLRQHQFFFYNYFSVTTTINMDSLPPIETVYQAVFSLYNNPDTSEKERASQYLNELQKSVNIFIFQLSFEYLFIISNSE